jgi:hypothetical protein
LARTSSITVPVERNDRGVSIKVPYDITKSPLIADKQPDRISHGSPDTLPKNQYKYLSDAARKRLTALDDASATTTFANKIAAQARRWMKDPEIAAGENRYSTMRDALAKGFGEDHELFSHLLGVTSPTENPVQNFLYALEAYDKFKAGDYDRAIGSMA